MSNNEISALSSEAPAMSSPLEPSAHCVQFYSEDHILIEELARLIGMALVSGDAAIVIASKAHRRALIQELKARDLNVSRALSEGRLVSLDAEESLSRFMSIDGPDPDLFLRFAGDVIKEAQAATKRQQPGIVIFGEMVALLWSGGKQEEAIRLEKLWNDLAGTHSFFLRCAYPIHAFYKPQHTESFSSICAQHSNVLPLGFRGLLLSDDERLRAIAGLQQKLEVLTYENTIRETERRFRLLVEAVQDYAIFTLDAEGRVNSWNVGAERLKGYQAEEIVGRHFSAFYLPEDIADGKPQRELYTATNEGRIEDEGWRVRKDGSRFWANVVITATKDANGELIGFSKVTRDFTERMQVQQDLQNSKRKLQDSEKSLRELSFHLLRTQDEERQRIGRDLHDSLGQYLSVLKMKLDSLVSSASKLSPNDLIELSYCAQITEEAVKEVRTILSSLSAHARRDGTQICHLLVSRWIYQA
jgi:PAS domain S-box-containing protein